MTNDPWNRLAVRHYTLVIPSSLVGHSSFVICEVPRPSVARGLKAMPRHWRCANGHTWTGDLGALTFCPECGSTDVYEVRQPGHGEDDAAPGQGTFVFDPAAGANQTVVQQAAAASDQTFIQPPPAKPGETIIQTLD